MGDFSEVLLIDTVRQTQQLLRQSQNFNHRQIALLGHALGNPDAQYTAMSHATSHQVTPRTARNDLRELAESGLLAATEVGRAFLYEPATDLERRIRELGHRRAASIRPPAP